MDFKYYKKLGNLDIDIFVANAGVCYGDSVMSVPLIFLNLIMKLMYFLI